MDSKDLQYLKNTSELHLPIIFTTSGVTPHNSNSVVPPIRKECPVKLGISFEDHTSLQRFKKDLFVRQRTPPGYRVAIRGLPAPDNFCSPRTRGLREQQDEHP